MSTFRRMHTDEEIKKLAGGTDIQKLDLSVGDAEITYDTTDGLTISSLGKINDEKEILVEQEIPLKAGTGLSMDVSGGTTGGKLEIKLDNNIDISRVITKDLTVTGNKINFGNGIELYAKDSGTSYGEVYLPTGTTTARKHYLLSQANTKTIFGNQSIFGSGNIDLYRHNIKIEIGNTGAITGNLYATVYSSSNTVCDSLTDLKTVFNLTEGDQGVTINGDMSGNIAYTIFAGTGNNLYVNYMTGAPTVTLLKPWTVSDTVTTI